MAITRQSATPKEEEQQPTSVPLPPSLLPVDAAENNSNLNNNTEQQPQQQQEQQQQCLQKLGIVLEEGAKPEFYTKEHEKLLGNTDLPWTFGVDGYGADGNRIYDQVIGKTCHQCRHKTIGLRTRCCKCNLVQGHFCGDCLYARYGEHVVEANKNPDWVCPPCRGICNCGLCRRARGWPPTGALYRRVLSLGFKSVAHYLIKTKQVQGTENNAMTVGGLDPKSVGGGRTRKKSKKGDVDIGEESVERSLGEPVSEYEG